MRNEIKGSSRAYLYLPPNLTGFPGSEVPRCPLASRSRNEWNGFRSGFYHEFKGMDHLRIVDERILKDWEDIANQGHPLAKHAIGAACTEGKIYKKNEAEAFNWYVSATTTRIKIIKDMVVNTITPGKYWKKNNPNQTWPRYRERINSYKEREGIIYAQFALGRAYHEGRGVERDEVQGITWLSRAAEHLVDAFDELKDYERRKELGIAQPE